MIDLRHGDALEGLAGLPDASVDHVITDPPFDARTHRAALEGPRRGNGRTAGGELPFAALGPEDVATLAAHFARLARRWVLVFCGERQVEAWAVALETAGARFVRTGLAMRTNPKPQLSSDRPGMACDHVVIAHAGAGRMRWNGGGKAASWPSPPARFDEGGQQHPTQKPLALMRALVRDFTDRGELLLDPFAGSGTTAVACRIEGRRFLGWELDPGYHAAAVRRLEGAREQLELGSCATAT